MSDINRRAAACIKACEGISTENLESNLSLKELAHRYNAALRERDALRAEVAALAARSADLVDAIKRLCDGLENYRNTSPWGDDDEDAIAEARALADQALTQPTEALQIARGQ